MLSFYHNRFLCSKFSIYNNLKLILFILYNIHILVIAILFDFQGIPYVRFRMRSARET